MSDTQIVMAPRKASPRRTGLVATLGIALGIGLGFGLAQVVQAPSPAPAVAAVKPATIAMQAPASPPAAMPAAAASPVAPSVSPVQPATASPPAGVVPTQVAAIVNAPPRKLADASVASRLEAGRNLLASAPANQFSVQLMVTDANSREYLESWLADAGRSVEPGKLYLVPAAGADAPRVGVLFGSYADRGQASEALAALPAGLRQFRPYVRSLDAVREDARRAPGR